MKTTIHPERIRQIMRYAVAVAATGDDVRQRELGPIHLIKYVYLADLAHAERHDGSTWTGLPWRFHHFGPWSVEAWEQIEPSMDLPEIRHRSFQGRYQGDVSRWRSDDAELEGKLESELPLTVGRAVRSAVRQFTNETSDLLHHVYCTPPMLRAAPGERLDFSTSIPEHDVPAHRGPEEEPTLSKTAQKRRRAAHDALKARFQEAGQRRRRKRATMIVPRPPRYDEVFAKGQEWLDGLAGQPIEPMEGELIVSEEIWKSPTRSEPSIP